MKQFAKLSLLSASIILITACGEKQQAAEPKKVEITTEAQKQAYAHGGNMASFLKKRLTEYQDYDIQLDKELVIQGFVDVLNEKSQIEEGEFMNIVRELDQQIAQKRDEVAKQKAQENRAAGEAFLKKNAEKEGITTTASGLQYEVVSAAEGAKPKAEDTVKVHYTGTLLDGTKFDSSVDRGTPAVFPLNRVIKGWTEGLQLMPVGSKYRFYIPADLAYGDRAAGKIIKPGSTLIFDVELLEIPSK